MAAHVWESQWLGTAAYGKEGTPVLAPRPLSHLRKCPEQDRLGSISEELFLSKLKGSDHMSLLYTGTVKLPPPPPEFAGSKAEVNRESTTSSAVLPPGSHVHLFWLLILAALGLCRQSSEVRGDRQRRNPGEADSGTLPSHLEPDHRVPSPDPAQGFQPGQGQATSSIGYKTSDCSKHLSPPSSRACFAQAGKNWKLRVSGPSWPSKGLGETSMGSLHSAPSP